MRCAWVTGVAGSDPACVNAPMTSAGNAAAGDDGAFAGSRRWNVFGKAMGIVLLWHVIPVSDVAAGLAASFREESGGTCVDTCGWDGLIWAGQIAMVTVSLLLSTVIVAVLSAAGRRRPALRRVVLVGNVGAVPGILVDFVALPGLIIWLEMLSKPPG